MWFYVVVPVSNYSVTLEIHVLNACGMFIFIVYPCYDEFWRAGQTFSLFCLWHDFVMSGMGGETVPIPCKNRWLVFGSAGMNPTPLKRTIS